MSADRLKAVPEPTLRRLPGYHHLLRALAAQSILFVSCNQIGAELQLDPTQVRKDLETAGLPGKPKVGYSVVELMRAIETLLGWNNAKDAFLAGAGNLGSALLGYSKFRQFGLNIVAAFDIDPEKVGRLICGKHVLPLAKLTNLARRMHIHLGVITAPAEAAQSIAHMMVEGGIRAIWNFAPVRLRVPDHIIVQNESLYSSLAALSFKLDQRLKAESESGTDTHGFNALIDGTGPEVRTGLRHSGPALTSSVAPHPHSSGNPGGVPLPPGGSPDVRRDEP